MLGKYRDSPCPNEKGLTTSRRKSFTTNQVRETGFEPAPLAGLDPKSSASANSATLAHVESALMSRCKCLLFNDLQYNTLGLTLR